MSDNAEHDGTSVHLQSKEHRGLLDIIDKLRSQGISRYVDLPQIIVCGDQSSGKSSVLEAISGMSFPTKDNLCTRFATELILRRNPTSGIKVCIIPSADRSDADKTRLSAFSRTPTDMNMGEIVEAAKEVMGLNKFTNPGNFSKDILRVEISGPTQPHLTMVDLPGLFVAGNKDQSTEDAKLVDSLVTSYMEKPRSIILAVVSAKSDFALQQVTERARKLDPKGHRTLGLITKPDTLDVGSDSEQFFVDLAQNKDVNLRLGWHVLRNRDFGMRDSSTAERDRVEAAFFSQGIWTSLRPSQVGVTTLRSRLSNVLRDQILIKLPNVIEDVQKGIDECTDKLGKLGASRATIPEQRRYLLRASEAFSKLVEAAVDGIYTDPFFSDSENDTGYKRRLRAVVQNSLSSFSAQMRYHGHARIIGDKPPGAKSERYITRNDYLTEVEELLKKYRGRELPGTYNPLIVAELFSQQCHPWTGLVSDLTDKLLAAAYTTVRSVLGHVADEQTASALFRNVIEPAMEDLKRDVFEKVEEILDPHISGHPITYNHYLTENVQKAQIERHKRNLEIQLQKFFGLDTANGVTDRTQSYSPFNLKVLLDKIMSETEPNMDRHSCSVAADFMEAYYKVNAHKLQFEKEY